MLRHSLALGTLYQEMIAAQSFSSPVAMLKNMSCAATSIMWISKTAVPAKGLRTKVNE
jgi:hypothetical protein